MTLAPGRTVRRRVSAFEARKADLARRVYLPNGAPMALRECHVCRRAHLRATCPVLAPALRLALAEFFTIADENVIADA